MSGGNLNLARTHAVTCNGIEECAPTVSAPYLAAAIERCKLPIRVGVTPLRIADRIIDRTRFNFVIADAAGNFAVMSDGDAAVRAYLRLCETILESAPANPPDAETATPGSTATLAGPGVASSSRSAALPPMQARSVAVAEPTPGSATASLSDGAA